MKKLIPLIVFGLALKLSALAAPDDSVKTTFVVTPRLHSAGYFPYTGALLNHNPVADVNVFVERKSFGFFVFQSLDIVDRHSYANYLQPGVFATLRFRNDVRLRTFVGYIFSQANGFRDADADYYIAASLNWDITKSLRIENTLLYYDIVKQSKLANRLLVSWTWRWGKADVYVWNRQVLDEAHHALSASAGLSTPTLRVSKHFSAQLTASYIRYITNYKPSYALGDGFFLTISVPVDFLPEGK